MKIPGEKTLSSLPVPRIHTSHIFLWRLEKVLWKPEALHKTFLRYQKEVHGNKAFMSFYPLFGIGATKVKTVFLSNSRLGAISVSLTTDIYKNRP